MDYLIRAKKWYTKALNENDPFVKFILYYITLEVLTKMNFLTVRNLRNNRKLQDYFFRQVSREQMSELKLSLEQNPLLNENPSGDKRWSGKLTSSTDFNGVVEYIIRARNNLFHGDKGPNEKRDLEVMKQANLLIKPIVEGLIE